MTIELTAGEASMLTTATLPPEVNSGSSSRSSSRSSSGRDSGPSPSTSRSAAGRITTTEAARRLYRLNQSGADPKRVLSEVVEIATGLTGALGVIFLSRDEAHDGRLTIQPEHFSPPHLSHLRSLLQHVSRLGAVAAAEESPQAGSAEAGDEIIVVAVPVIGSAEGTEALAAAISVESTAQARATVAYLTQILTWIAAYLGPTRQHAERTISAGQNADLRRVNRILEIATQQDDLAGASHVVADWLREQTACSTTVVGIRRGWQRQCQILGYSGTEKYDERTENLRVLKELLEETVIASSDDQTPNSPLLDASLLDTRAVVHLRRITGLEIAARYPLHDAMGNPYGAVLCLQEPGASSSEFNHLPLETLQLIGQRLSLLKAAEPNSLVRSVGLHRLGKRWYRHPFTWSTAAALIVLMLVPMPMRIKCSCQVQPKQRRFVSVPYEGRLEEALAEPGEIVKQGQLLARMDGRNIEWEISGLTAELQRAEKDRDKALAAFDAAQSQMAGLESKRLQLQIDSLQERLQHLEIRSPVDGIVMGGDPRKLEGSRLSMGETLLEVGPMDEMIVEIEVTDEDISHVAEQQQVRYRLAALPWKTFVGPITLIHPRSESRNNQNVFVAEVELKNEDQLIRPGMHGRAKIRGDYHPLGWNLFHKAWEGLVSWVAW